MRADPGVIREDIQGEKSRKEITELALENKRKIGELYEQVAAKKNKPDAVRQATQDRNNT